MMRWTLERVSEPDIEPVSLTWAKRELDEFSDVTDRDDDISAKITAAREWAEWFTGRALIDQSWRLTIDHAGVFVVSNTVAGPDAGQPTTRPGYFAGDNAWSLDGILLRRSPVLAITSLKTVDSAGVETTVDAATYELREADGKWPRLVGLSGASWTTGTFRILFRAGYADRTGSPVQDATAVPARFKQAVIQYTKWLYNGDADAMKSAEALLRGEKAHMGMA